MGNRNALVLRLGGRSEGGAEAHDPLLHPELYEGVVWRRIAAFAIDMVILGCLFALASLATCTVFIVTFGLVALGQILIFWAIGIAYATLTIGGRNAATPGMRAMGLVVRTWDGGSPDRMQALLMSILFWATAPATFFLVLALALFNPRSRCLHDYLSGTVVLRAG